MFFLNKISFARMFFLLFFMTRICVFNSSYAVIVNVGEPLKKIYTFASNPNDRVSSAPLISADTFRSIAQWFGDETGTPIDTDKMQRGDIVYLKGNVLDDFLFDVHPHIKEPYILLVCDSDHEVFKQHQIKIFQDGKILAVACSNCLLPFHPKAIPLPLGISKDCNPRSARTEDLLKAVKAVSTKDLFCTTCFRLFVPGRKEVLGTLLKKDFVRVLDYCLPEQYAVFLARSVFCISPRGAGEDCFRTWEALSLNTIPVVTHSMLDPLFYKLPVLIVDDYDTLEEKDLKDFYAYVQENSGQFHMDKVFADYWLSFLQRLQEKAQKHQDISADLKEFKIRTYGMNL